MEIVSGIGKVLSAEICKNDPSTGISNIIFWTIICMCYMQALHNQCV